MCVCVVETQSRGAIKNRLRAPSSFLAADGAAEEIEKKQAQRRELSAVERTPRIITSSSFSWQSSKEEAKQQQQLESFKRREGIRACQMRRRRAKSERFLIESPADIYVSPSDA